MMKLKKGDVGMKKLYLGLVLMVTSAIIIAGALIGGGAAAAGKSVAIGYSSDIIDSQGASFFIFIGVCLYLIGLLITAYEAYAYNKKD